MAAGGAETPTYTPHIGESRQYWRDIILGVNDGLVSTYLLVVTVVSGGLAIGDVLLTGIAGALAGSVSMAAGEYLATKSQDEVLTAELALEVEHLAQFRNTELEQLREMFTDMGIAPDDLETVVAAFDKSDEAMLNVMAALEFGVVDSERRSPYLAMAASGLLFLVGAIPSVLPFAIMSDTTSALIVASVLTFGALFIVGAVKARVAKTSLFKSGLENLAIAGVGGVIAWLIGDLIGAAIA